MTEDVRWLVGLFGDSYCMYCGFEVGTKGDPKEPEAVDLLHSSPLMKPCVP